MISFKQKKKKQFPCLSPRHDKQILLQYNFIMRKKVIIYLYLKGSITFNHSKEEDK